MIDAEKDEMFWVSLIIGLGGAARTGFKSRPEGEFESVKMSTRKARNYEFPITLRNLNEPQTLTFTEPIINFLCAHYYPSEMCFPCTIRRHCRHRSIHQFYNKHVWKTKPMIKCGYRGCTSM